jgi:hypothetical protein
LANLLQNAVCASAERTMNAHDRQAKNPCPFVPTCRVRS